MERFKLQSQALGSRDAVECDRWYRNSIRKKYDERCNSNAVISLALQYKMFVTIFEKIRIADPNIRMSKCATMIINVIIA